MNCSWTAHSCEDNSLVSLWAPYDCSWYVIPVFGSHFHILGHISSGVLRSGDELSTCVLIQERELQGVSKWRHDVILSNGMSLYCEITWYYMVKWQDIIWWNGTSFYGEMTYADTTRYNMVKLHGTIQQNYTFEMMIFGEITRHYMVT